ncbi:hypothetical protein G6F70_005853 [Rhizopus microsporus]|uniref:Uncharacterized protein n=2 Tax=Rhizopus TaxID=4842 RepID=A0A367JJC8_RHIAZ|nr:hypothetical protein G6F71_005630 [Rhizopus microsporus]RCH90050.1 hypothetical protein CU097_011529 [Rhizopus azygosporus]KAG1198383.1 hypothetical protein G6F70_005853 [Rhizopus microsporus]KAG1210124.1 hypothetical protein G6F69_005766 [Rhizopus microsporus]KAG1231822.1 hypothetical protein G6F67_005478 [Rhizopus microsporus]
MTENSTAKNPEKSKLALSVVRPLSVLIPPSWTSTSSSESETNFTLDQISSYAKKITSSNLFSASSSSSTASSFKLDPSDEHKRKILKTKSQQALNEFTYAFLLSLNNSSLGLYTVSDHIYRKVPRLIEMKKKIQQISSQVETADLDIQDAQKSICDIERIDSFVNMSKMIKLSLEIIAKDQKSDPKTL